jgi:hypothetical protein
MGLLGRNSISDFIITFKSAAFLKSGPAMGRIEVLQCGKICSNANTFPRSQRTLLYKALVGIQGVCCGSVRLCSSLLIKTKWGMHNTVTRDKRPRKRVV